MKECAFCARSSKLSAEHVFADWVQFTAPNKDLGVANRDLGTVVSLEGGQMALRMDGKSALSVTFDTAEFRQFDHGYAVTSHSSQGLTAGRVLAHIDTDSSRGLINDRLAYVAISRASDDARVYTNNAETLGERLASDITKTAAVEFIKAPECVHGRVGTEKPLSAEAGLSVEVEGLSFGI